MLHANPKIWGVTAMGERGQVVIPAKLREEHGIAKGDDFVVVTKPGAKIIMLMPEREMTNMLKGAIDEIEKAKVEK